MDPQPTYRGYPVALQLTVGERKITLPRAIAASTAKRPDENDYISIDLLELDAAIDKLERHPARRPGAYLNNAVLVEFERRHDGASAQAVVVYDPMRGFAEHVEHFTGAGFAVIGDPIDIGPSMKPPGVTWSRTRHDHENVHDLPPRLGHGGAETSA
jgi:hypothetical protein